MSRPIRSLLSLALAAVLAVSVFAPAAFAAGPDLPGFITEFIMRKAEPPENEAARYLSAMDRCENGEKCTVTTDGTKLYIDCHPGSADAERFFYALQGAWSYTIESAQRTGTSASVAVNITCVDTSVLKVPVAQAMADYLEGAVAAAHRSDEIYDGQQNFKTSVLDSAFAYAVQEVLARRENCSAVIRGVLTMEYTDGQWVITNLAPAGNTLDERISAVRQEATKLLEYIPKNYTIAEDALAGPVPDQTRFGITEDPSVITALSESVWGKNLRHGQKLLFSADTEFRGPIRYYLDETIFVIVWQEREAGMLGTFSEIFIADGSQLRRKIAGDTFGDMHFKKATEFAAETNSVLTVGGDLYNHGRNCGIMVYQRQIFRFDPKTCDTCYITSSGDMLFSYQNQFAERSEAEKFVADNDVLFSLCFGPVMIDDGQDVTPEYYNYGEIRDTYARAALGLLGDKHYLTMNLNCGRDDCYGYATLRMAADAMVKRGCRKAYTLDGGQTCCTIINGELINPVQFGYERDASDILYFATAVPDN